MIGIERLSVLLDFGTKKIEVGELVLANRQIYFKYNTSFLSLKIEISPFKLPLKEGIFEVPQNNIEGLGGLHGVFSDSLPDGWGRLLLDRALAAKGIIISDITPLDRLAYVGKKGFGALTYAPKYDLNTSFTHAIDLDKIATEITKVYEGTSSEILDELYTIGGSPGGARPKITVGYNPKTDHLIYGKTELPDEYEHWIIKYPSTNDLPDIAQIEYAYYKMAVGAGIEMTNCKLFTTKNGNKYFGTKRFDRIGNQRLHLHSAAGILEDNFRRSTMDYGHIMHTAFQLEKDVFAYEKVFRLAAFNVLAHNKDDHSKNFAFLMNENGEWKFAPAYDLTYSSSGYGMQSTMVAGESRAPGKTHLLKLANEFSMKNAESILNQVQQVLLNWTNYGKLAGVSKKSIAEIKTNIALIAKR